MTNEQRSSRPLTLAGAVILSACALVWACGTDPGPKGGPVAGEQDLHCQASDGGTIAQPIKPSACNAPSDGGTAHAHEDVVLFNASGDDDECKYHVSFTTTPIRESTNVTFIAEITEKATGLPAEGANPYLEVFLDDTHPAPNTNPVTEETSAGVYTISPVQFDLPGRWTVEFHLHGECSSTLPESPHSHVGFFIDVPAKPAGN